MNENVVHYCAYRIRAFGSGDLYGTFYDLAHNKSFACTKLPLELDTGIEPTKLADFTSQRAILRLEVRSIGDNFNVNRIIVFAKTVGTQI